MMLVAFFILLNSVLGMQWKSTSNALVTDSTISTPGIHFSDGTFQETAGGGGGECGPVVLEAVIVGTSVEVFGYGFWNTKSHLLCKINEDIGPGLFVDQQTINCTHLFNVSGVREFPRRNITNDVVQVSLDGGYSWSSSFSKVPPPKISLINSHLPPISGHSTYAWSSLWFPDIVQVDTALTINRTFDAVCYWTKWEDDSTQVVTSALPGPNNSYLCPFAPSTPYWRYGAHLEIRAGGDRMQVDFPVEWYPFNCEHARQLQETNGIPITIDGVIMVEHDGSFLPVWCYYDEEQQLGWTRIAKVLGTQFVLANDFTLGKAPLAEPDASVEYILPADLWESETSVMMIEMGVYRDYFIPNTGTFADMYRSYNSHTWSAFATGPFVTPSYNSGTVLGGSGGGYDPGDGRAYVSFWGYATQEGGCCHREYGDTAAWDRAYDMYITHGTPKPSGLSKTSAGLSCEQIRDDGGAIGQDIRWIRGSNSFSIASAYQVQCDFNGSFIGHEGGDMGAWTRIANCNGDIAFPSTLWQGGLNMDLDPALEGNRIIAAADIVQFSEIRVTMGNNTDYFKPIDGRTLAEMLQSHVLHTWKPTFSSSYVSVPWYTHHLGGCDTDFPSTFNVNDTRVFIPFWGDDDMALGGCCQESLVDVVAWSRSYAMYAR